jgi:transposase
MHKQHLTEKERTSIVRASEVGNTKANLSFIFDVSERTINNVKRRYSEEGRIKRKKRTRFVTKFTPRDRKDMVIMAKKNPFLSYETLKCKAKEELDLTISRTTVRRILNNAGFFSYVAKHKPLLTKEQIKFRLQYSKVGVRLGTEFWKKVIFSDETEVSLYPQKKKFVIRKKGTELAPSHILPAVKHSPKIMIWGCFGYKGVGALFFCEQRLNSEEYINVLNTALLPSVDKLCGDEDWFFQQDNAPCHKSRATMNWLQEHEIEAIAWPANSPDLNPIENVWAYLKQHLYQEEGGWETVRQLRDRITAFWNKIPSEFLTSMFDSYETRLKEVITNRGKNGSK